MRCIKGCISVLHINDHAGVLGYDMADRMSVLSIEQIAVDFVRYTDALYVKAIWRCGWGRVAWVRGLLGCIPECVSRVCLVKYSF